MNLNILVFQVPCANANCLPRQPRRSPPLFIPRTAAGKTGCFYILLLINGYQRESSLSSGIYYSTLRMDENCPSGYKINPTHLHYRSHSSVFYALPGSLRQANLLMGLVFCFLFLMGTHRQRRARKRGFCLSWSR